VEEKDGNATGEVELAKEERREFDNCAGGRENFFDLFDLLLFFFSYSGVFFRSFFLWVLQDPSLDKCNARRKRRML
jgi:hypothetical protein